MVFASLLCDGRSFPVSGQTLVTRCDLFKNNIALLGAPYQVMSPVPLQVFRLFVEALEGKPITIGHESAYDLSQLCDEFGVSALSVSIGRSVDPASSPPESESSPAPSEFEPRLAALEDLVRAQQQELIELRSELRRLAALAPPPSPANAVAETPLASEDEEEPKAQAALFESTIVDGCPPLFSQFEGKKIRLLYRGSRDGFGSKAFHNKCNMRSHTLTIVKAQGGCIFGGYTPVPWGSTKDPTFQEDAVQKSFLFTLINPHGIPARTFPLIREQKDHAIMSGSAIGPAFGGGRDLMICDECNTREDSYSCVGSTYKNDTKISRTLLLTGARRFLVEEIEVFQISM
jgi:hypothetical protein